MNRMRMNASGMTMVALMLLGFGAAAQMTIPNVTELQELLQDYPDGDYVLTQDIDAGEVGIWNSGAGFEPLGTQAAPFTGTLDGAGYTISNLHIHRPGEDHVGLFGFAVGATIENVGLANAHTGGNNYVGGLVGSATSCSITNCRTAGNVSGNNRVGGLVGSASGGSIINCRTTGGVSGSWYVGGLAGYIEASGAVTQCYSTGSTSGATRVGGLVGLDESDSTITNCYSTGCVAGGTHIGGLLGMAGWDCTVTNCYSTGCVSLTSYFGGLLGFNDNSDILGSYWDTETSGVVMAGDGTGKTTAQMMHQSTFAGWDFSTVWGICEGETYPYLQAIPRYDPALPAPVVFIEQSTAQTDPAQSLPIVFEVLFSAPVIGFDNTDVDFSTGTVSATDYTVTDNGGGAYTIEVTGVTRPGNLIASIPADAARSCSDTANLASISADNSVTYDPTPPPINVTVEQAAGQADPATGLPIQFEVLFDESVTGFDASDVVVTGPVAADAVAVSGVGSDYTIWINAITADGTITAAIPADVCQTAGGASNNASTSADNTVTYGTPVQMPIAHAPLAIAILATGMAATRRRRK